MRVMVLNRSGDPTLAICLSEEVLSLTNAAKRLPARRGDRPPHVSCLFRWAKHGLRGVRLETIRVGGTLCTSREALERFFARLAETDGSDTPRTGISSVRQRQIEGAHRQAGAALQ
jgi:hypothetical protein